MFDVCIIGHITKDIVRINGKIEKEIPGGTAYYTSIALKSLGLTVAVITKVSREDRDSLLCELERSGIAIYCYDSDKTTIFENIYRRENLDVRAQKVKAVASPFSPDDLAQTRATIFHFGPLMNRDISLEILEEASLRGKLISLDVQGFVRAIKDGEVIEVDWQEKKKGLAYIDILKTDENEARILSGEDDLEKAAIMLSRYGPNEVIITLASKGSLIYSSGKYYRIPAYPAKEVIDPTGCGDTYIAGYLYQRLQLSDFTKSGKFAALLATFKLENFGPFKGSEEEIRGIESNMGA